MAKMTMLKHRNLGGRPLLAGRSYDIPPPYDEIYKAMGAAKAQQREKKATKKKSDSDE